MNRSLKHLAWLLAVTTLTSLYARGQSCWEGVTSFQGNYTLSSNGSGSCPPGTCTVNQSVTANVDLTRGSASCSDTLMWGGQDTPTSLSVNDVATSPCPLGGTLTEVFTANQSGGTFNSSHMQLTINVANGTYAPDPHDGATVLLTVSDCGSTSQNVPMLMYPATNWPQTYNNLPTKVQPLVIPSSPPPQPFQGVWSVSGITVPWTFSFELDPNYTNDKDCHKDAGSSVGCENQSLSEDVPVAGTKFYLHYESNRAPGAAPDPIATRVAAMMGGWTTSINHAYNPNTNTLLLC